MSISGFLINAESPQVIQLRNELSQLEEQRNEILEQHGENQPQITEINNKIEAKKQQLVKMVVESAEYGQATASEKSLWETLEERKISEELDLFILENRERFYQRLLSKFKSKHPDLLEHTMEIARLIRTKSVSENLFNFLLQKGEEAKIKAATGTGGIRIIDHAILPSRPIPQNTAKNLLMGVILGFGLGFGLALLQESMNNTIHTNEDVTEFLKLPLIGIVPMMKSNNIIKSLRNGKVSSFKNDSNSQLFKLKVLSNLNPRNAIAEAYRSMLVNINFSSVDKTIKTILVTSASPSEGKSITSANLGIIFAEGGNRTLILDADLRKPMQHKLFNIEKKPGMTDYLFENAKLDDIIYKTNIANLGVIPIGITPPNPSEIFNSQKFADFMTSLTKQFDIIIVDTPPVMTVADAAIISINTENVLFVVKFNSTQKIMAKRALETLQKGRANILGVVLNEAQFSRGYGYYQYYKYYDYYTKDTKRKRKS